MATSRALTIIMLVALPGCGMAAMVETNTRTVQGTTAAIRRTTSTLEESNRVLLGAQSSLDRLGALHEPMERVADLEQSMRRLAELKQSMEGMQESIATLGALKDAMDRLHEMKAPMTQMRTSLQDIKEPMEQVAALDAPMRDVAELKQPMERVATLHSPMVEVSKLSQPMLEVTQMGTAASRQTGIVAGGLLAWGIVTFLGVYFGVQAGTRRRDRLPRVALDAGEPAAPRRSRRAGERARLLLSARPFGREAQVKET